MADDIVTRLDAFANEHYDGECVYNGECPEHHAYADLVWEASATIGSLRHQLQGVWAIANLLATRLENVSSGNAAVLHQFDREVEKARLLAESDARQAARRG